jgi:multiple sugar transport system permease protein
MDSAKKSMTLEQFPAIRKPQKNIHRGIVGTHAFLITYIVVILIPFVWLFVSSLKNMGQYYSLELKDVWLPWPLHFDNYMKAINNVPLFLYLWNSIWLASVQTLLSVFSSALVAYGFSRFEFKGRMALFTILIASLMLPTQVTQIPLFLFYSKIGFVNSFKPLIIPTLFGGAYSIFLISQFMMSLPKELDEAAMIDGCNTFTIFRKVILPQTKPALIVAGLFAFLNSWKDTWAPLIYLSSSANFYTLPLGLLFFAGPTRVEYTVQLAAIVIALVPTVIFYLFGQKYLESGINIGDLK